MLCPLCPMLFFPSLLELFRVPLCFSLPQLGFYTIQGYSKAETLVPSISTFQQQVSVHLRWYFTILQASFGFCTSYFGLAIVPCCSMLGVGLAVIPLSIKNISLCSYWLSLTHVSWSFLHFCFPCAAERKMPNLTSFPSSIHLTVKDIAVDGSSSPSCTHVTIKASKTDPVS